jgi:hypothetical protein
VVSLTFIRGCGLAAIGGGIGFASLLVFGGIWYSPPDFFPPILTSIILLLLIGGALAAIAGAHALQRERYGRWGAAASLIAFAGGTILFLFALLNGLGALLAADLRNNPIEDATDIALIVGVPVATVGIVALGTATIAVRVLPWWCGALIILGSPPVALLFTVSFLLGGKITLLLRSLGIVIQPSAPLGVAWLGIAWALVGYVLFRRAEDRLSTPDG